MSVSTAPGPESASAAGVTAPSGRRSTLWQLLALVACMGGFALSLHLLHRAQLLKHADLVDVIDPCTKLFNVGCDGTLRDERFSAVLGVPIAGWGMIYFAGMAALLVLSLIPGDAFRRESLAVGLLASAAGAVGAIGLASLMVSGVVPFCPYCVVVHVVCLVLLASCWMAQPGTIGAWVGQLSAGLKYLCGAQTEQPVESMRKTVGFLNVLLVMAMVYQWVIVVDRLGANANRAEAPLDDRQKEVLNKYDAAPVVRIPVDEDDPRIGAADAPAQLVVFSTFRCKGCRTLAIALDEIRRTFPDETSIVFKYQAYKTDECGEEVAEADAPASCRANWAAEAARRQGRFWEFHDALFAAGYTCDESALAAAAQEAGLDMAKFDADRRSADVRSQVAKHLALGSEMQIVATPDVYLNGRRISGDLGNRQLDWLVDHAVEQSLPEDGDSAPAANPAQP